MSRMECIPNSFSSGQEERAALAAAEVGGLTAARTGGFRVSSRVSKLVSVAMRSRAGRELPLSVTDFRTSSIVLFWIKRLCFY